MIKFAAAFSVAAALFGATAQAATIDFANYADTTGERGLSNDGEDVTIDGINLRLEATGAGGDQHAYLDASNSLGLPAGLGSCAVLDAAFQCNPSGDDNVTVGESVSIRFLDGVTSITNFEFRDADHVVLGPGEVTITTGANMIFQTMTDTFENFVLMAMAGDAFFRDIGFIEFAYADTQFYVTSLDVSDIPIPAALPLLLSGLAGLGFVSRKRRKAA